jgi:hypothetical protein
METLVRIKGQLPFELMLPTTNIRTRTYIHTYIHTYTHTHIHTYIQTYMHIFLYTYINSKWINQLQNEAIPGKVSLTSTKQHFLKIKSDRSFFFFTKFTAKLSIPTPFLFQIFPVSGFSFPVLLIFLPCHRKLLHFKFPLLLIVYLRLDPSWLQLTSWP